MTREQLWAYYAAAALSAGEGGVASTADYMLEEHLKRFPQDQRETAS